MPPPTPRAPVLVAVARGGSVAGVRYGAAEALRSGRELHLVHVGRPEEGWALAVGRDALRLAVVRAQSAVGGRVPVRSVLAQGEVVDRLQRAAAAAALLVGERLPASEHRRRAPGTLVALAASLDAPMVVVPGDWVSRERRVVTVGLDPAMPDDTSLRAAVRQARLRGAVLRVVAAGPRSELGARLARCGADGCDVAVETAAGSPAEALLRSSASSDLVVVGRHHPPAPRGSRLGAVALALLHADPDCPVLLTTPGHEHAGAGAPGSAPTMEERHMYAQPGDRIVVRSTHLSGPIRDGEIIEVEHADGRPPYRVRWSDDGHESLFYPGPDAYVDRAGPSYQPEYDVSAHTG